MSSSDHSGMSRRAFVQGAVLGAAGPLALPTVQAAETEKPSAPSTGLPGFDFTKDSAAMEADHIVASACQFCNSLCRLKVHVKAGRIIDVQGEPGDPVPGRQEPAEIVVARPPPTIDQPNPFLKVILRGQSWMLRISAV